MSYERNEQLNFNKIISDQYERILIQAGTEFTGGYWNTQMNGNVVEKVYVPDSRAEFTQEIKILSISLSPYFTDKMNENWKSFKKEEFELKKKYSDSDGFIKTIEKNKYSVEYLELCLSLFENISDFLKLSGLLNFDRENNKIEGKI